MRLSPSPPDSRQAGSNGQTDPSGARSLPGRLAPFLFWRRRLVFRLVASFLIVSLAVLALTGYFATSRARDSLENEVVQRLEAAAALRETSLDQRIADARDVVRTVTAMPDLRRRGSAVALDPGRGADRGALRRLLTGVARENRDLAEVFVMTGGAGLVVASTRRAHEGGYETHEPYFIRGASRTTVEGIYPSSTTGDPALTVATPLRDARGRRAGVLAAHVDLDRLRMVLLDRRGLGDSGETYFVDEFNNFVSPARFGRRDFPRGVHTQGIDRALAGRSGAGRYRNYAGEDVIGVYRWVPSRRVAVVAELRQSEAFASARRLGLTILLGGLLAAGALAVGTFLLARQIARPILALTRTAGELADGRLGRTASVTTDDEIGALGHSFNRMSRELRDAHAALEQRVADLAASEERYALAARGANDGLWDWHLLEDEIYLSARWKSMLGYRENEVGSDPTEWFDRVHSADLRGLQAALESHLEGQASHLEAEFRMRARDGSWLWMLARGEAVHDDDGAVCRIAGSLTDISERKAFETQLVHGALHDPLTGLANRVLFAERLEHLLERAQRHPEERFAVLFVDLDEFKVVNDSLGHLTGDALLTQVAERFNACLRPADTIARFGGDEFAVLLEAVGDRADALQATQRLQDSLTAPIELAGREVFVSASIGIAFGPEHYRHADEVLRDADTAMYRAKTMGRGRHVPFDADMHLRAVGRLGVESELRRAIERREFELHYQPIVSLESRRIHTVEGLLRWQHPERGLLAPSEFIGVAEDTGLIVPIGWFVLDQALRDLARWQRCLPRLPEMSVNVSRAQLRHPEFVHRFARTTRDGNPDIRLNLEITESAVVEDAASEAATLARIRDLGVGLHVDDFGTGYSSLATLHQMPIGALKIDRSFIATVHLRQDSLELVRAIVSLARNLRLEVIAEGVESEDQLAIVRGLGCDYAQGFLFSRPLRPEDLERVLERDPLW